jgi:hypothetical protein
MLTLTNDKAAAIQAEIFIRSFPSECANEPLIENILTVMKENVTVRDYAMGLTNANNLEHYYKAWTWITNRAEGEEKLAPATILATVCYELGNKEEEGDALLEMAGDYSLAMLLKRSRQSDWNLTEMLPKMRAELHPKVEAEIFGDDNE